MASIEAVLWYSDGAARQRHFFPFDRRVGRGPGGSEKPCVR